MKLEVFVLGGQRIDQKSKKGWREARGNEEREKREDEKGSHCFFKSSGYYKLELKHHNLVFSSLYNVLLKWHGVKQNAKNVPLVNRM